MGACRKKPAQPASGTLSWMTPSETLLRLCLGGFGDMKWAWGGGWRLPAFLCQTTSSPGFCPISRAHFRDRKTLRKRVHHKGPPLCSRATCTASRSGTCSALSTLRLQEAKDPLVAAPVFRELVHAAARQVVQQLGLLQRPQHRGPAEGVLHRRQLSKVPSSRNRTRRFVESSAMSAHSPTSSCVTSSTAPRADGLPHPVVRRCAPKPRFCTLQCVLEIRVTPSPSCESCDTICLARCVLPVPRMPDNKRLWPLRQCSTGSSTWRQGSCSVGGSVSSRGSWYSPSNRFTSKRYLGVRSAPPRCAGTFAEVPDRPDSRSSAPPGSEAALREGPVDPRQLHVLRSHDEIVGGLHGAVGEELRGVDVVVVAVAPVVEEDLLVLAAPAVHLVIGCSHAVEDVLGPGPESDESVDGELGHVPLALGPGSLHDVQSAGEAVRRGRHGESAGMGIRAYQGPGLRDLP